MKAKTKLTVAGVAICACVAGAQVFDEKGSGIRVGIKDADGYAKGIVGVCSANTEQVDCWSPSGEPDSLLTERVEAYFIDSNNATIHLDYHQLSRFIIFQEKQANSFGNQRFRQVNLYVGGQVMQQSDTLQEGNDSSSLLGAWVRFPKLPKSLEVRTSERKQLASIQLPLKVGAEASRDGYSIQITDISKGTLPDPHLLISPHSRQPQGGANIREDTQKKQPSAARPAWFIKVKMSDQLIGLQPGDLNLQLLDVNEDVGYYADSNSVLHPYDPSNRSGSWDGPAIYRQGTEQVFVSKADPSGVSFLNITPWSNSKSSLGMVAMYPKHKVRHL